jgi:hypothetical protein
VFFYCSKPTVYLVAVSKATRKKKVDVTEALSKIGTLAFGTKYWIAVASRDGKLLYYSFQADQQKLSFTAGWSESLRLHS